MGLSQRVCPAPGAAAGWRVKQVRKVSMLSLAVVAVTVALVGVPAGGPGVPATAAPLVRCGKVPKVMEEY